MINLHLHCAAVQSIALGQWFQLSLNNLFLTLCAISLLWHCNLEIRIYVAVDRKKKTIHFLCESSFFVGFPL